MDTEQVRSFANTLLEVDSAGSEATARHRRERASGIVKLWTSSPFPTARTTIMAVTCADAS